MPMLFSVSKYSVAKIMDGRGQKIFGIANLNFFLILVLLI